MISASLTIGAFYATPHCSELVAAVGVNGGQSATVRRGWSMSLRELSPVVYQRVWRRYVVAVLFRADADGFAG
ncbi:MAG: hypothetical protein U5M23_15430 [Marinagarivorans sp.]|nr:hypothetical protein [Marinagarivorans sp.]